MTPEGVRVTRGEGVSANGNASPIVEAQNGRGGRGVPPLVAFTRSRTPS
jgi:hypothetical protein